MASGWRKVTDSDSKSWREWEGVEPTQDGANRPATVLKTARPTGTHPLPDPTTPHHPEHWNTGTLEQRLVVGECSNVPLLHCSGVPGFRGGRAAVGLFYSLKWSVM